MHCHHDMVKHGGNIMAESSTDIRVSRATISNHLRRRIVSGELPLGGRLPNRREITEHFGASSVTVQRAMDRLAQDGFIYADGPNGTFVSSHPPHLCRYGLVFTVQPGDDKWLQYHTVMVDQALRFERRPERLIGIYYRINQKHDGGSYQELVNDLHCDRLAGLILVGRPNGFRGTPVTETTTVPRVALMEEPGSGTLPAVGHDTHGFIDQALDYLHANGRSRIAIITGEGPSNADLVDYFKASVAQRGWPRHPYWIQGVSVTNPKLARNLSCLLMHDGQVERPDGLIVSDDNLSEHVVAGLRDIGVSSPQDLHIVVHANFPAPKPNTMPTQRIGYDARQTLEICLDVLDRRKNHQPVPPLTFVPATSEQLAEPLFRPEIKPRAEEAAEFAMV